MAAACTYSPGVAPVDLYDADLDGDSDDSYTCSAACVDYVSINLLCDPGDGVVSFYVLLLYILKIRIFDKIKTLFNPLTPNGSYLDHELWVQKILSKI